MAALCSTNFRLESNFDKDKNCSTSTSGLSYDYAGLELGTQICHPFGGGQNGWHTSIYLLNGKTWLELPTTVEWVPDEEGKLMACTYALVSGVYAMFGYWEWFEGYKTPEPTQQPRPV